MQGVQGFQPLGSMAPGAGIYDLGKGQLFGFKPPWGAHSKSWSLQSLTTVLIQDVYIVLGSFSLFLIWENAGQRDKMTISSNTLKYAHRL